MSGTQTEMSIPYFSLPLARPPVERRLFGSLYGESVNTKPEWVLVDNSGNKNNLFPMTPVQTRVWTGTIYREVFRK